MIKNTIKEKMAAQRKLQAEKHYPDFAPGNGVCWKCRKQIYDKITMEQASNNLITGCPYCGYSFCD